MSNVLIPIRHITNVVCCATVTVTVTGTFEAWCLLYNVVTVADRPIVTKGTIRKHNVVRRTLP